MNCLDAYLRAKEMERPNHCYW